MDAQSRRVLEYDKVLAIVAKHAHWQPGADIVLNLLPASGIDEVVERQAMVKEACRLYDESTGLGAGGLVNCLDALVSADRGRVLSCRDLLSVADLARASAKTGNFLKSHADAYPYLADRALGMGSFVSLENSIRRAISEECRVLDSASPRLRELRSNLNILQGRVRDHLNGVLRNTAYSKMLQESLVTVRSERYVIPIKAEYRGHFPGLVIDQSASGATLFMEPFTVVDLENRMRAAALAEQKEIETVLARLSGMVGQVSLELQRSFEELAWYDAMSALATYDRKVDGVLPEITDGGSLRLVEARHPLLVERLGEKVVPTTITFGDDVRTLVVTGPNTGGKTVMLKTTGLVLLMALAGLPVPARVGTTVPFLEEIWADIGDEQSISQSLSTFSAHMTQILRILPKAGPRTFVMIDELGAGTDPSEGGALGMALLEYFHAHGALTVVTTHLSELKVFASKTPGVSNAAVEFDAETLAPTYKVTMGIPGRSNALRIAYRLGLPDSIERRARELLGNHHVEVEGLLDELEQERDSASRWNAHLQGEHSKARELVSNYETKLRRIEDERGEILQEARAEAKALVDDSRSRVHGLLRSTREHLAALDKLRRQSLADCQKVARELSDVLLRSDDLEIFAELSPVSSSVLAEALREASARKYSGRDSGREGDVAVGESARSEQQVSACAQNTPASGSSSVTSDEAEPGLSALGAEEEPGEDEDIYPLVSETPTLRSRTECDKLDSRARVVSRQVEAELDDVIAHVDEVAPPVLHEEPVQKSDLPLEVGASVYVHRYGQEGTVLSLSGNQAEVKIGAVRMKIAKRDLEVIPSVLHSSVVVPPSTAATVSTRIDLHGMNVDEALHELGYRIDEAFMGNAHKLEIIHGKGTGILRKAVTEYVSHHPMIAEHRFGEIYEGGMGVTVVTLK